MLVFSTHAFTEGDVAVGVGVGMAAISTHAFTEGDGSWSPDLMPVTDFNSRLHGRRHGNAYVFIHSKVFQLTPSRKATANSNNFCC